MKSAAGKIREEIAVALLAEVLLHEKATPVKVKILIVNWRLLTGTFLKAFRWHDLVSIFINFSSPFLPRHLICITSLHLAQPYDL